MNAADLGIAGRYHRLLDRMLEMLAEDGVLAPDPAGWRVVRSPEPRDPAALLAAAEVRYPESANELAMLARCGEGLAEALRGAADPLELLFPGGSLDEAERMYRASPFTREPNALVATAVASLLATLPADRPLRVLEIGGGTGGTTAHLLPLLPAERTRYTFTDVSPAFVERARSGFGTFPFLEGRVLDIAASPAAQGFASGYDLIVAANVLHATPDLRQTLRHVRQLLAPGGTLVLLEGLARHRFADLTVGLTDGWWNFADARSYALAGGEEWLALLGEAGLDARCVGGDGLYARHAVLVARAAEAQPGTWLLLADAGTVAADLAALLEADGNRCVLLRDSDRPAGSRNLAGRLGHRPPPGARRAAERTSRPNSGASRARPCSWSRRWPPPAPRPASFSSRAAPRPVADGDPVTPAHASLWGFGKTVALEHPELSCTRIDLDPAGGDGEAAALHAELRAPDGEDQIALRADGRRVARLVRRPGRRARPAADPL